MSGQRASPGAGQAGMPPEREAEIDKWNEPPVHATVYGDHWIAGAGPEAAPE